MPSTHNAVNVSLHLRLCSSCYRGHQQQLTPNCHRPHRATAGLKRAARDTNANMPEPLYVVCEGCLTKAIDNHGTCRCCALRTSLLYFGTSVQSLEKITLGLCCFLLHRPEMTRDQAIPMDIPMSRMLWYEVRYGEGPDAASSRTFIRLFNTCSTKKLALVLCISPLAHQ